MLKTHSGAAAIAAALFVCALAWAPTRTLAAAQFAVEPLRLNLPAEKLSTSLTLSNGGAQPVTVHAELLAWNQDNGEDTYAPAAGLIVSPPVFKIPAGSKQVVRIGRMKRGAVPDREQAYRVKLSEVAPSPSEATQAVSTVMQISLPMFVPPADRKARPATEFTAVMQGTDLRVSVINTGLVHDKITRLTLVQDGKVVRERTLNYYVLAGAKRGLTWPGALKGAKPGALELKVQFDGKDRVKTQMLGADGKR